MVKPTQDGETVLGVVREVLNGLFLMSLRFYTEMRCQHQLTSQEANPLRIHRRCPKIRCKALNISSFNLDKIRQPR